MILVFRRAKRTKAQHQCHLLLLLPPPIVLLLLLLFFLLQFLINLVYFFRLFLLSYLNLLYFFILFLLLFAWLFFISRSLSFILARVIIFNLHHFSQFFLSLLFFKIIAHFVSKLLQTITLSHKYTNYRPIFYILSSKQQFVGYSAAIVLNLFSTCYFLYKFLQIIHIEITLSYAFTTLLLGFRCFAALLSFIFVHLFQSLFLKKVLLLELYFRRLCVHFGSEDRALLQQIGL